MPLTHHRVARTSVINPRLLEPQGPDVTIFLFGAWDVTFVIGRLGEVKLWTPRRTADIWSSWAKELCGSYFTGLALTVPLPLEATISISCFNSRHSFWPWDICTIYPCQHDCHFLAVDIIEKSCLVIVRSNKKHIIEWMITDDKYA